MKKVLIVDDDRATRLTIKKMLEDLNLCAIQCHNGDHALQTLMCNQDISLVITDMVMPETDGRWLIQSMHKHKQLGNVPIIIMSSVVGVKDIADLLDLGAKAFVHKPVKQADIKEYTLRYIE